MIRSAPVDSLGSFGVCAASITKKRCATAPSFQNKPAMNERQVVNNNVKIKNKKKGKSHTYSNVSNVIDVVGEKKRYIYVRNSTACIDRESTRMKGNRKSRYSYAEIYDNQLTAPRRLIDDAREMKR